MENNFKDEKLLRNSSINEIRHSRINIYNNYGILPNNLKIIGNKLHNSSPSNFKTLN